MAIKKLVNKDIPKIIFGIILTNLEEQLFRFVNQKIAFEILRENFKIKSNRLIKNWTSNNC